MNTESWNGPFIFLNNFDDKRGDFTSIEYDDEIGDFNMVYGKSAAKNPNIGGELYDMSGGRWRIISLEKIKEHPHKWWDIIGRSIDRDTGGLWTARYNLEPLAPLELDEVKTRIFRALDADRDVWRDDELVAGEAGTPISEEVVLAELKKRLDDAHDMAAIFQVLDQGYDFDDAVADGHAMPMSELRRREKEERRRR
ncbi:hypothetical protein [Phenylobacterium immobile]|uniref:hypothetical protein n=1 Tax=Phenylobacterium immobile TaxID=21 RepID=UPI000A759C9D|nr:hypothetical protein [Phenylobacterium immobile]